MSKNTRDAKFRNIDVDKYDENSYQEDEGDDGQSGPNESEIQGLLSQGKNVDALRVILTNPPVTTKNQAAKDKALQLVMRVLTGFRSSEIDAAIKTLDQPKVDVLMKYIYRGFEIPTEGSSAQLLTWHEKAFAVGGLGSIVRVLTDRKRV